MYNNISLNMFPETDDVTTVKKISLMFCGKKPVDFNEHCYGQVAIDCEGRKRRKERKSLGKNIVPDISVLQNSTTNLLENCP